MRKFYVFIGFVIAILVGFNVNSLIKLRKLQNDRDLLLAAILEGAVQSESSKLKMLKMDQLLTINSSGEKIPHDVLLYDETGQSTTLGNICCDKKKFVFRYTHLDCDVCIDAILPQLESLSRDIGIDNVVFLATYSNNRDLYVFKHVNEIRNCIYNIDLLSIALDKINLPYCFVLNADNSMSHLFIPRKEMLDQTEEYFKIIRDLF